MAKNLTNSYSDRQKIINDPYTIQKIEKYFNIRIGEVRLQDNFFATKNYLARFLDIDITTIDRYIATYTQELKANGYIIIDGQKLEEILSINPNTKIDNKEQKNETLVLELFSFKAWLNIVMLLSESEHARLIRNRILDIVIDVVAEKEDGQVKYLNWTIESCRPDISYMAIIYPINLLDAVKKYLELEDINITSTNSLRRNINKYSAFISHYDEVYKLFFGTKYSNYKNALAEYTSSSYLERKERERKTSLYQPFLGSRLYKGLHFEVLQAIISVEKKIAEKMQSVSEHKNRKITRQELDEIVANSEHDLDCKPFLKEARTQLAIIDYFDFCSKTAFKDTLSKKLEAHYKTISEIDLDEFIEAKSKSVKEKLVKPEILAVFQRLQDR